MPEYFFSYIDDIPKTYHSSLFSFQHITALAMVACFWILFIIVFKDRSESFKWKLIQYTSLLLPLLEIAQMVWYKSIGEFSLGYTLPLHLCSLMSVLLPVMAFTRNRLLQEYAFAMGLAPALLTLVTPDVYYYPAFSFIYMQTMVVHGIICLIPVFMVAAMGFRPRLANLPKTVGLLVVFAVMIVPVNHFTDGNYFFLRYPAPGSPMEAFAAAVGSPWYLIPTFLLGCVLWTAMYLPFALLEARDRQRTRRALELLNMTRSDAEAVEKDQEKTAYTK